MLDICQAFATELAQSSASSAESLQGGNEYAVAAGGLGVALHLLCSLATSKPLLESGQTLMLTSRDKPKTDPAYFEPHEFLVKLRATVFPTLRTLWNASWLEQLPLDVVKMVVQGFLEVMGADGEEVSASSLAAPEAGAFRSRRGPRFPGPDETLIQQLGDMGFPRASAELALTRTHNNLSEATEFLLLQPHFLIAGAIPPQPRGPVVPEAPAVAPDSAPAVPEVQNTDVATAAAEPTVATAPSSNDVEMQDASDVPIGEPETATVEEPVVTAAAEPERDWLVELKEQRATAVVGITERTLTLVDKFPDLVFELKKVFIGDKYQLETVKHLLGEAKSFLAQSKEDPSPARLRLLALIFNELPTTFEFSQEDVSAMVTFFTDTLKGVQWDGTRDFAWLASLLLALEALLIIGEDLSTVPLPKADEPVPSVSPTSRNLHSESRPAIFDFCLRIIAQKSIDRNQLLASLRLLVLLTRNHQFAVDLVSRGGLVQLLDMFKETRSETRGCQVHVIIILRHIIEDRTVLETIMKRDLVVWFSQPRVRVVDVSTLLVHLPHVALRDPIAFIESCKEVCMLSSPTAAASQYLITLKNDIKTLGPPTGFDLPVVPIVPGITEADAQVEDVPSPSVQTSETLDVLLRFLLNEVTRVGKLAIQSSLSGSSDAGVSSAPSKASPVAPLTPGTSTGVVDASSSDASTQDFVYTCFLLQCLTELLAAYNACKVAFVNFSRKRLLTSTKDISKPRTALLQFILSDLIPVGDLSAISPPANTKRRITLSIWAMSVVVSLCLDPSGSTSLKDIPSEVLSTRKFVLDAIAKSIRDPLPGESLEARYGRLGSLADLSYRLLSRTSGSGTTKPVGDAHLHIPKLMLEKNFVSLLTTTLGEVDLNFPNVRTLVNTLVRPLELLYVDSISDLCLG